MNAANLQRDVMRMQATDCDVEEDDDDTAKDGEDNKASTRVQMTE